MNGSDLEKDEFWDLSKLVPKKKLHPTLFATTEPTVPYQAGGEEERSEELADRRLSVTEGKRAYTEHSYVPKDNPLIRKITIRRECDKYDFYDSFRRAALLYYDVPGIKCDFVSFYSYMPQYSQMTKEQKGYYFYWRSEARRGRYIKTDYSYLYLYVYELINLPEKQTKEEGLRTLCALWCAYRKELPKIDKFFSVWVQDYCMLYELPSPTHMLGEFIFDIVLASGFREFYLSDIKTALSEGITAMTACLSDYDWRAGKYAKGEHAKVYQNHMEGALRELLLTVLEEEELLLSRGRYERIVRDAFPYSLCTHSVKSRIEIEYYPLSAADALRSRVTAAIKYIENRLRALLGVKSRLAVRDLPNVYKTVIDGYFEDLFKKAQRESRRANMPVYEKMYDVASEALSHAGAEEIENASWEITLRLVAEEEAKELLAEGEREEKVETPTSLANADTYGLASGDIAYLAAVADEDMGEARRLLCESHEFADAVAERINEAFCEHFGDVILESDGTGYTVIPDYKEDLEAWLLKIRK